jgi:internalin A
MMKLIREALLVTGLFLFVGCENSVPTDAPDEAFSPPVLQAPPRDFSMERTIDELLRELKANKNAQARREGGKIRQLSLFDAGVKDISPLRGLQLTLLDLTNCSVDDLSPLEGMPLEQLFLQGTKVTDLSPLTGLPLKVLRMEETPVKDIEPLRGMSLEQLNLMKTEVESIEVVKEMSVGTLWLTDTRISDLSPLNGKHLISLDIEGSRVASLEPLRGMVTLERLNLARANVSDLTPLEGLSLQRLIFTPGRIERGIEVVRSMPSIRNIGIDFDSASTTTPEIFWPRYDAGLYD